MVDAVNYVYDLKGNLTDDGTYTYVYDYEDKLMEVKEGSVTLASVTYDPLGRRLSKTTGTEATLFIHDRDDILETYACDEDLTNCQFTRNYIYSDRIDEPLSFGISNTVYYHHDALGNTVALTDKNGNLKETYQYDPYGKPHFFNASGELIPSSTLNNPYLFTGREYDPETQLYYYRARYYSSRIGRFLQRDPYTWGPDDPRIFDSVNINNIIRSYEAGGLLGDISLSYSGISGYFKQEILFMGGNEPARRWLYGYGLNNPINVTDPSGQNALVSGLIIGGLLVSVLHAWTNFINRAQAAGQANDAFGDALQDYLEAPSTDSYRTLCDRYREREQGFQDAAAAGINAGSKTPGTSVSGPPPTSTLEALISLLQNLVS